MSKLTKDVKRYYGENKEAIIGLGILSGISLATGLVAHVGVKLIDKIIK